MPTAAVGTGGSDPMSDLPAVFVGDLSPHATEAILLQTFQQVYASAVAAKLVIDTQTGRHKGYAFVRFTNPSERDRAVMEMNGAYCLDRAMRVREAAQRRRPGAVGGAAAMGTGMPTALDPSYQHVYQQQQPTTTTTTTAMMTRADTSALDPSNTTLFIGGLDAYTQADDLTRVFCLFGELTYV
eukprot:TRINITY_DN1740_c0_g2_i2.p1 TRINITY_DN1740_c0_g2~~TRINITY_DN1740_c0_g2_i2.p1  ORF type:complete len:184 (+),score=35.35 TRINITY_DN1740_c0_g2_i2:483-1034(+)